jgi:hypothetical protein
MVEVTINTAIWYSCNDTTTSANCWLIHKGDKNYKVNCCRMGILVFSTIFNNASDISWLLSEAEKLEGNHFTAIRCKCNYNSIALFIRRNVIMISCFVVLFYVSNCDVYCSPDVVKSLRIVMLCSTCASPVFRDYVGYTFTLYVECFNIIWNIDVFWFSQICCIENSINSISSILVYEVKRYKMYGLNMWPVIYKVLWQW